ncbi:acyltransferase family protein [Nonomuraea sp. NPDC059194]|uniref:acyltransferase family protein n=1 Tax=Nonomuraea sp. NPDC059194 TaxID=3346764 RepID=UPI0036C88329
MRRRRITDSGRLAELDLLRFIAAMAVLAFHFFVAFASVWGQRPSTLFPWLAPVAGLGILGVELFFVISGFVILMTVWGRGLGAFAWSRFVRLYPAYWLSLAAVAVVYGVLAAKPLDPKLPLPEYLLNATMFQRLFSVKDAMGVYWSLWAELRFYLLISIVVIIGVTHRRVLVFMTVWLAAALALVVPGWFGLEVPFLHHALVTETVMPAYAGYFVAGMALYLIHRHGSAWLPWLLFALSWVLAVDSAIDRVARRIKAAGFAAMPVTETGVVFTITLIFAVMAMVALGYFRMPSSPLLTALGGTTYPLYLFHSLVAVVLIPPLVGAMPAWALGLIATLVTILLSYLVYSCAERPIQRFLRPRRTAQSTPMPAVRAEKASVP